MADEKSTALVPHEGEPQLPTLVAQPLSANDLLVRAQERAGLINLTRYAIACTRESHWVDFDGSPYFTSDAAEWVAERVGISYRPIRRERYEGWDDAGPYYGWEYDVEAWFEGTSDRIVEVGECTSRDKLYGKKGGKFRPLHEIDEANIKRKAYVNGVARVVRARLGIGGLTWKEVKALIGKSIDPAASVSFKTDDKKASEKKTSDEAKSKDNHPNAPQNASAPPQSSGRFNKMKRVQELKKFLMDNRVCADIKTYREFVSGVLPPEKCQYDELGEVEVMQGWDKADVEALWEAAEAKVGGSK